MAQRGVRLDRARYCCPICVGLPQNPVTLPCGHSYCMSCIKTLWDKQEKEKICSCPECRLTFSPRPVLVTNTVLKALVEELFIAEHCFAGPEDVACDVCTGRKLKALKACLVCLASYCEKHIQPHYESPTFKKHRLLDPSKNICTRHVEMMKLFCRTDQQCICQSCSVDQHEGHDIVKGSAERTERQRQLELRRQKIQLRIKDREKDVNVLQQEVEAVNASADRAVSNSERIFNAQIRLIKKSISAVKEQKKKDEKKEEETPVKALPETLDQDANELIHHMEERRSDVTQQIRFQQETEVSRVKELQEKLEQEISELTRKDTELQQLSHVNDHNQFICKFAALSPPSPSTHPSSINIRPLKYFKDVTTAVLKVRGQLQDILSQTGIQLSEPEVDVLKALPEPESRDDFLQYSKEFTLDPNTAHTRLVLSEGNRKVTVVREHQSYSTHPDRFTYWSQVLSTEGLTGRCYWEVKWRGGNVCIAVAYKDIMREGSSEDCWFGSNKKSWTIICYKNSYYFYHNSKRTQLSGPQSSRIGVYLDHGAGILCFYSITDTMTRLHKVQTSFDQPLHAGLSVYYTGDTVDISHAS